MKIFAGKAAPSYAQAKLIIKLINDVARVVNSDPSVRGLLKVVFLPNYNVSLAEIIIPAADLSEQISTAGLEASGTGNMKFALNGALTIGTLDGANVEIWSTSGAENIFIFGLTADEVAQRRREAHDGRSIIDASPVLRDALGSIVKGVFSPDGPERFQGLVENLYDHDWCMIAADFEAYWQTQRRIDDLWRDQAVLGREGRAQHRADGLVLLRPLDPRICQGHLAHRHRRLIQPNARAAARPAARRPRLRVSNPWKTVLGCYVSVQGRIGYALAPENGDRVERRQPSSPRRKHLGG